jgi:nitric oxide reductase activation protein
LGHEEERGNKAGCTTAQLQKPETGGARKQEAPPAKMEKQEENSPRSDHVPEELPSKESVDEKDGRQRKNTDDLIEPMQSRVQPSS